ncbi:MAG: glycosyltransferase family 2 protein [Bacteroidales bacterium]|nr:glycosyltransferase family 2 protein [Bacteroidales bacterium]MDT8374589.1 glycosyltransferase family 2 protein [Bacteroidales bacterium]
MELSVIIVSYNVRDYLRQALLSVGRAAEGIDHEITIVDNASSDGSTEMVRGEFSPVRLIVSGANEGYAAACNRGIGVSSGDFILILNPDTVVAPDALTLALTFMHEHPDAGAAGARMTDGNGRFLPESKRGFPSPMTSLFRFSGLGRLFPGSPLFNAYYLGHLPEDETCRADILTGAFMLIRREALDEAGLFDTSFFMYGEDIDMSWRIRQAGWFNYYLADVHIVHYKGRSPFDDRESRVRHFYGAMKIFAVKHLSRGWHLPVKAAVTLTEKLKLALMPTAKVD